MCIVPWFVLNSGGLRMQLAEPLDAFDATNEKMCYSLQHFGDRTGENASMCAQPCDNDQCTGFNWDSKMKACSLYGGNITMYSHQNSVCYTKKGPHSSGDPHSRNTLGQHFDIRRPGNYTFLKYPRGGDGTPKNLDVQAHVTSRGKLCSGKLYITGLEIAGSWLSMVGGRIELYTETDMFNSPQVVGLKIGNSSNMSLQEFDAHIPTNMLSISHFSPQPPEETNKHVNTLTMQFNLGPSKMKVGWAHEKVIDGFTNWLWLSASGLGNPKEVGGLLGADDHLTVQTPPEYCHGKPGLPKISRALNGWAWVDP